MTESRLVNLRELKVIIGEKEVGPNRRWDISLRPIRTVKFEDKTRDFLYVIIRGVLRWCVLNLNG